MDDSQLPTPHNNFFHYAFSQVSAVRGLIETHLSEEIVRVLDLKTLVLQKGSFVDPQLRESYSDLLYSVQTAMQSDGSRSVLVYVLLEHKSQPDQMTPFQLLRYMVRIWEQRWRNGEDLAPVIPMVIYHGENAWSAPRTLEELIPAPDVLQKYGIRFTFPLLDLGRIPDETLATDPFLQSMLRLLKYAKRKELFDQLEPILQLLLDGGEPEFREEQLKTILVYILATSQSIPMEKLRMTVQKIFPTQIEPGSLADQLIQKGREKGIVEGREEGRQEGREEGEIRLIQALQEILGVPVSDEVSLKKLSLEQLRSVTTELRSKIQQRPS